MSGSDRTTSGAGASSSQTEITRRFSLMAIANSSLASSNLHSEDLPSNHSDHSNGFSGTIECSTTVPEKVRKSNGNPLHPQPQRRHKAVDVGRATLGKTGISKSRHPGPRSQCSAGRSLQRKAINSETETEPIGQSWDRQGRRRSEIWSTYAQCLDILDEHKFLDDEVLKGACDCRLFASDNLTSSSSLRLKGSEEYLSLPVQRSEIELIWYRPACDVCFGRLMHAHYREVFMRTMRRGRTANDPSLPCTGDDLELADGRECGCPSCDMVRDSRAMIHIAMKHMVDEIKILRPELGDPSGLMGITDDIQQLSMDKAQLSEDDGLRSGSGELGMEIDEDV